MLYLVGLGLGDEKDITVKGLEIVRKCHKVYLEHYTSILTVGKDALERYVSCNIQFFLHPHNCNSLRHRFKTLVFNRFRRFYGREVILADRDLVEQGADELLEAAKAADVAFLVVGDPFGATTHSDLVLRASAANIPHAVVHNASILNAVGCCGLQLYNFGETVSVVFWTDSWKPESFFDKILKNRRLGFHTLCLLDIKVKEQSVENLLRGRKIYEPPRFMSVKTCSEQFLEILDNRKLTSSAEINESKNPETESPKTPETGSEEALDENSLCVGVARIGADDQKIVVDTLRMMASEEVDEAIGGPLHSLIIPAANPHPLELDMLRTFAFDVQRFDELTRHLQDS